MYIRTCTNIYIQYTYGNPTLCIMQPTMPMATFNARCPQGQRRQSPEVATCTTRLPRVGKDVCPLYKTAIVTRKGNSKQLAYNQ